MNTFNDPKVIQLRRNLMLAKEWYRNLGKNYNIESTKMLIRAYRRSQKYNNSLSA